MGSTASYSQSSIWFISPGNDMRDSGGSRHPPDLPSVPGCKSCRVPLMCFPWSCRLLLLLPESFWSKACSCSISFGLGMPLSQWSHLGLFSRNRDFLGMLLCLGSSLHHGSCENIGFSSSVTLLCSCRKIQKPSCSLRLTGRQTSSSHLSWLVSFSCVSKNQDENY